MIEEIAEFHGGQRESLVDSPHATLPKRILTAKRRGGFVWISLIEPNAAEFSEFADLLGLHPLAAGDAVSGKQQPKIQAYDEHLFVSLRALTGADRFLDIAIAPTFLFVREGLLITVQHNRGSDAAGFGAVLDDAAAGIDHGVVGALYAIMRSHVEVYTEVADRIETELEKLENQVFDERVREGDRQIYRLRKQIGRIQRAISGMSVALETSKEHLSNLTVGHEPVEPYFRDLIDDLAGTNQLVADQDRALDGVLASHQNNVAILQNADTRKISAFAALLSVPAVLAGIFGMNFKNLPGVDWTYGWEVLIAVIVVLDIVLFLAFKRRHWL